ncbi:hypothetical protein CSB20_01125, partial [bacterium DOLZORAL124_64_63]
GGEWALVVLLDEGLPLIRSASGLGHGVLLGKGGQVRRGNLTVLPERGGWGKTAEASRLHLLL